jgi:glycosyltransferase involved in cell wall biosynthesis/peptidoglycan/xylan/chitin deacetylase (PgdA/CDA1 family)
MNDMSKGNGNSLSQCDFFLRRAYFFFKPLIPKGLQIFLRQHYIFRKRPLFREVWPIDEQAKLPPPGWTGWPEGKRFALVLTHDVETGRGQEACVKLAGLEESLGFRSCFNFIAKQYEVSLECHARLKRKGFEIGLHGLHHDENPFQSRRIFRKQVTEINRYLREWDVKGFRCPSMYHNLDWIGELDIEYDSSTFDTDPFEPQPDGVGTIFPFWVRTGRTQKDYLELPYTLPQDHTLFVLMGENDIGIWKKKLDWIAAQGGMALLITHPDYMDFEGKKGARDKYPMRYYADFLEYIRSEYDGQYWNAIPGDVLRFWKALPQSAVRDKAKSRKKNVVMVAYSNYIVDARIRREAETLVSTGEYEVTVLALNTNRGDGGSYTHRGVTVQELQISKYRGKSHFKYMLSYLKFMLEAFSISNKMFFGKEAWAFHIHNMPNFLVFSGMVHRFLGGRLILDIHDLVPETYSTKFKKLSGGVLFKLLCLEERLSCKLAHRVICTNHLQREMLVKRGIDSRKIAISMNVPDRKIFRLKDGDGSEGPRGRGLKLVYHGTLAKRLGIDLAIQAVADLGREIPGLEFYVLGDGDDEEEFKELARSLKVDQLVHFSGVVPLDELGRMLKGMDLGVVPNRENIATEFMLPVKLMEYAALDIPVVVPRLKIINYYFSEEMVSFFKPGSVESLANAILELYRDESKRKCQVKMAKRFLEQYGWEKQQHEFLDVYERLYH